MVKRIKKHPSHADEEILTKTGYGCFCNTCGKVFSKDYLAKIHVVNRHQEIKVKEPMLGFLIDLVPQSPIKISDSDDSDKIEILEDMPPPLPRASRRLDESKDKQLVDQQLLRVSEFMAPIDQIKQTPSASRRSVFGDGTTRDLSQF